VRERLKGSGKGAEGKTPMKNLLSQESQNSNVSRAYFSGSQREGRKKLKNSNEKGESGGGDLGELFLKPGRKKPSESNIAIKSGKKKNLWVLESTPRKSKNLQKKCRALKESRQQDGC